MLQHSSLSMLQELKCSPTRLLPIRVGRDRQPAHAKGIHENDSVNMLAAKMDLLMKRLESPHQEVNQIMEPQITCEKCGNTGHSGKSCSFTQEDENSIGNNTHNDSDCRPQQG